MDFFKADWARNAPPLDELVKDIRDERIGKKAGIALIIPSFRRPDLLRQHIAILEKQSMKGFDIIAVYGQDDDYIKPSRGIGMVHIRRKFDIGSAGAFYLGELYALKEGYEILIIADDDCLPITDSLLLELDKALKDEGAASPWVIFTPQKWRSEGVISMYRAYRRETFEKAGLSFLPFYTGGEDFDLMWRIKREGIRTVQTNELVCHPKLVPPIFWSALRVHHYGRNSIHLLQLQGNLVRSFVAFFAQSMMALAFKLVGNRMAGAYWGFIISAAIGAYFYEDKKGDASDYVRKDCVRKDFDRIFTREQKTEEHSGIDYCIHEGKLAGTNRLLSKIDGTISGFSHILGKSWGCFNKNVLFDGAWDESDTIVMLFSRSSALSCDGKTYGIGKERDMLLISAHLLIMMVAVVPVAILSGILSCSAFCSMMIRGISSRGYGKEMIDGKNRGRII